MFENDCRETVLDGWNKYDSFLYLPDRISRCVQTMKQWAGMKVRSVPGQIKRMREKLNSIEIVVESVSKIGTRNRISGLVSSHGDWLADSQGMSDIIDVYFAHIFKSNNHSLSDLLSLTDSIEIVVESVKISKLDAPCTAIETRKQLLTCIKTSHQVWMVFRLFSIRNFGIL